MWDIIDTRQRQERKKYKPEQEVEEPPVHINEDGMVLEERSKWGWLYEKILSLHKQGIPELEDEVLWEYLELKQRGIKAQVVGVQLKEMGIARIPGRTGHYTYTIDDFDLTKKPTKMKYVLATA